MDENTSAAGTATEPIANVTETTPEEALEETPQDAPEETAEDTPEETAEGDEKENPEDEREKSEEEAKKKKDPFKRISGFLWKHIDSIINSEKKIGPVRLVRVLEENSSEYKQAILDFGHLDIKRDPAWKFPGLLTAKVGAPNEEQVVELGADALHRLTSLMGLTWLGKIPGHMAVQELEWKASNMKPFPLLVKYKESPEGVPRIMSVFKKGHENVDYAPIFKFIYDGYKKNVDTVRVSATKSEGLLADFMLEGMSMDLADGPWTLGIRVVSSDCGVWPTKAYPTLIRNRDLSVIVMKSDPYMTANQKLTVESMKDELLASFTSVVTPDEKQGIFNLASKASRIPFSFPSGDFDKLSELGILKTSIRSGLRKKMEGKEGQKPEASPDNLFDVASLAAKNAVNELPHIDKALKQSIEVGKLLQLGVKYLYEDGLVQQSFDVSQR